MGNNQETEAEKYFPTFQKYTFSVLNVWYWLIKNTNMIVSMSCSATKSCLTLCDPWTIACQAPLSMRFPGKSTGVGCHFPLQGISLTQGLNPRLLHLLHWQVDSLPVNHLRSKIGLVLTISWFFLVWKAFYLPLNFEW